MPMVERDVMLRTIDWQWMEYLTQMEQFREGIGLRAYGQRDPLIEYKNEAFEMFNELRDRIEMSIVSANLPRVRAAERAAASGSASRQADHRKRSRPRWTARMERAGAAPQQRRAAPVGAAAAGWPPLPRARQHKIGRNDPCWCGSGKKYKRCHGR